MALFTRRNFIKVGAAASATVFMPAIIGRAQSPNVVNVMGPDAYLPKDVRDAFTAQTGIQVNFRQGATDASQIFNLLAAEGQRETDLCVIAAHRNYSYIAAGYLDAIDESRLTGISRLSPVFLADESQKIDGKRFGLPLGAGPMVSIYREDAVDPADADSWELVFGDKHSGRLTWRAGGVLMLALWHLGLQDAWVKFDGNPEPLEKALQEARNFLVGNKKHLRKWYDSSAELQQLFIGNEVDVSEALFSHAAPLTAGEPDVFKRVIPKEGTYGNFTCLSITTGAPHIEETYQFIDFLLNYENINGSLVRSTGNISAFADSAAGLTPDEVAAYSFSEEELSRIYWLETKGADDNRFAIQDKFLAGLEAA